jgi:hypothetical protein
MLLDLTGSATCTSPAAGNTSSTTAARLLSPAAANTMIRKPQDLAMEMSKSPTETTRPSPQVVSLALVEHVTSHLSEPLTLLVTHLLPALLEIKEQKVSVKHKQQQQQEGPAVSPLPRARHNLDQPFQDILVGIQACWHALTKCLAQACTHSQQAPAQQGATQQGQAQGQPREAAVVQLQRIVDNLGPALEAGLRCVCKEGDFCK